MSLTSVVCLARNRATRMARPTAASAAATVIMKKTDICACRDRERRKSLLGGMEVSNHKANLNEQDDRHSNAARGCEPIDSTPFFSLQVKKHDDEKEKHHYGAGVNQHLNDSDKEGVK